ncbi:MAG: hypothetical protein RIB30_15270 [Thalassospira sp.]|uniref:hypothetical protein n=1 Tax=Thalassospira sp. TaxID=1912094 RepID=UPI0032EB7112
MVRQPVADCFPDFWPSGPIGAFNFYPLLAVIIAAVEVGVFLTINEATPCGGIIEIRNDPVAEYSDSVKSNDKSTYS